MRATALLSILAIGLSAEVARATPVYQFVDNNDDTVTLQVVVDAVGSLGAEAAVEITAGPTLGLVDAFVADPSVWDIANPGANPFTGTITTGLFSDLGNDRLFASFGSIVVDPGTYDFLTIETDGGAGTLEASGIIAQQGVNNTSSTSIVLGGSTGPMFPQIQFVDNGDGSVTLQVVSFETGSTASELAFSVAVGDGLSIDAAAIVDPVFDTPNPGNNPFTGTITTGLYTDFSANEIFVSVGSDILGPGVFDLLELDVSGFGTLNATGLVAQLGELNDGLTASITLVPEPSAVVAALSAGVLAIAARRRG